MKAARAIGIGTIITATTAIVLLLASCSGPPHTAAEFCKVLAQQKRQYLHTYYHPNSHNGLEQLADGIGAMSDWVPIFQHLDAVAPPSIEPDVHNIVDSLKQEQQAAENEFSDPLGAIASGLEASMMSSASWDHVTEYISAHCEKGA